MKPEQLEQETADHRPGGFVERMHEARTREEFSALALELRRRPRTEHRMDLGESLAMLADSYGFRDVLK